MIIGLLTGLLTGFAMAIPPGPINFAIFEKSINGHRKEAYMLLFGALTGDSLYCIAAVVYQLSSELLTFVKITFSAFGGGFLIVLGIYYASLNRRNSQQKELEAGSNHRGLFFTGMLISLSNPFFIVAILAVTELYYSLGFLIPHLDVNILFIAGFQVGAFLWLWSMGYMASSHKHVFSESRLKIQQYCGWVYIGFGVYMVAKFLKLMGWLRI